MSDLEEHTLTVEVGEDEGDRLWEVRGRNGDEWEVHFCVRETPHGQHAGGITVEEVYDSFGIYQPESLRALADLIEEVWDRVHAAQDAERESHGGD